MIHTNRLSSCLFPLLIAIFTACTSSSTSLISSSPLELCEVETIHHEAEFLQDTSLKASFEHMTVVHLEKTGDTTLVSGDTHVDGADVIPYHLEEATTYDFNLSESGAVLKATLRDDGGNTVASLDRGDAALTLELPAGDYSLLLESDETGGLVFVQPKNCESSASENLSALNLVGVATPGVYIQELPATQSIIGATTAVTAFVGYTLNGPETPVLVSSWNDYVSTFGPISNASLLSLAVYQFFESGGSVAYVVSIPAQADGSLPTTADFIGNTSAGLYFLNTLADFDLLVIPDLARLEPSEALVLVDATMDYANEVNAFFIVDIPVSLGSTTSMLSWTEDLSGQVSGRAALYYPSVTARNPMNESTVMMGAGGAIAGIYTATDISSGVWKNPAGVRAAFLEDFTLEHSPNADEMSHLLEAGINPLRYLSHYGNVIWGARTFGGDPIYEYIATRRLLTYIEKSLRQSLEWTAFEPNNSQLQSAVTKHATLFLNSLWQSGGLLGETAAQAFAVICDAANNTPETIEQGILYLDVIVAPVRPAEFITLRLELSAIAP